MVPGSPTLPSTLPSARAAAGPSTAPLVAERLSDRLATLLANQVEQGALKPGDRLPTEPQLAARHGVSRTVVREAVHQLKSQGLLLSRQGLGVFVASASAHKPLAFDPRVLDSIETVVQIVEVRRALESEIAALAAKRATRAQISAMRGALQAIEAAGAAGRDGVDEDLAFHRAIAAASGNPQFTRLLGFLEQYLREAMRVTRGNEARRSDFMDQVRSEHHALLDAIAAGDAVAARRAATNHMLHAARRLEIGGVIAPPAKRNGGRK
jgi:GntR family transcriptional regulator, transcriptional repressor for pyruvate dehydrogenase complex